MFEIVIKKIIKLDNQFLCITSEANFYFSFFFKKKISWHKSLETPELGKLGDNIKGIKGIREKYPR